MKNERQHIQLACFSLGDRLFAVDIMRIKEIILPQKLSSMPRESNLLEGVFNLRGAVVPVMDLRKRFGMAKVEDAGRCKLLILSFQRHLLALIIDDVLEVITVPAEEIKPPPDVAEENGMEFVLGICLSGDQMYMILDIDSLICPAGLPISVLATPFRDCLLQKDSLH